MICVACQFQADLPQKQVGHCHMAENILWSGARLRTSTRGPIQDVKPAAQGPDFSNDGSVLSEKSTFEADLQTHLSSTGAIDENTTATRLTDKGNLCAA